MTDAHNHLQQLADPIAAVALARRAGVLRHIVNGTHEGDWEEVSQLANAEPADVIPAFGLHPWHVGLRSEHWLTHLEHYLQKHPNAIFGECGLDRWKVPFDLSAQLDCLRAQIKLAQRWQRPLTLHCLQAWGPLLECLQSFSLDSLPPFLLHSYSGSVEMIPAFTKLGAYFSFNGYFLHERKVKAREVFRQIPTSRLLLESDAPAMIPPPAFITSECPTMANHPANLPLMIPALARLLGQQEDHLLDLLENNCSRYLSGSL